MRYKFLDKEGKPLLVGKCQDDAIAVVNDIQTGLYWATKLFIKI